MPSRMRATADQERARLVQLGSMDETFLICRDISHAWMRVASMVSAREEGSGDIRAITRTLQCVRCRTEKDQLLAVPTYETISNTYRYPEGYRMVGAGVTPRMTVRREVWRRTNFLLTRGVDEPTDAKIPKAEML